MLPLVVVLVHVLLHLIVLSLLLPWVPLLAALFWANLTDSGWRPPGALPILSIQSFIILAIHSYPGLPALRGVLLLQPSLRYLHLLPSLVVLVGPDCGGGLRILILLPLLIIVSVGTLIVK